MTSSGPQPGDDDFMASLSGIGEHGFYGDSGEPGHGAELGIDIQDYLQSATNTMAAADYAYSFDQANGANLLYGNQDEGLAVWINSSDPSRSTAFAPDAGVEEYLAGRLDALAEQNPVDLQAENTGPGGPADSGSPAGLSAT